MIQCKKHAYSLGVVAIIILAICLRFINYNNRYGLAYDQAHDALLARFALQSHQIPVLGPFSSAGPYQTGGEWYWIIMLGTLIYPPSIIAPWIGITLLYVLFVYILIRVSKSIGGKGFSLLAGLLAAVSTAQVTQSTNLTNQSPLSLFSLLALWAAISYMKNNGAGKLFFLGLSIGIASSIHLSGVALVPLILALFIVHRKVSPLGIVLLVLGLIIPWLPVFAVDSSHQFYNTKAMLQYYLHDQYKIPLQVLGRRWLTYLGVFWPTEWANIIGGFNPLGYIEMCSIFLLFVFRKIPGQIMMILLSIVIMITIVRYTHTPIFSSYLVFLHPFILLITAWPVYVLINKWKIPGIILLICIVTGSLYQDYVHITAATNTNADLAVAETAVLNHKLSGRQFAVYTYKESFTVNNYVLSLFLTASNQNYRKGIKVTSIPDNQEVLGRPETLYRTPSPSYVKLMNINSSNNQELVQNGWRLVDGMSVYNDTEKWWTK